VRRSAQRRSFGRHLLPGPGRHLSLDATLNLGGAVDLTWRRTVENGLTASDSLFNPPDAQAEERFVAQPMTPAKVGWVGMISHWRREAPEIIRRLSASIEGDGEGSLASGDG